jgi:hypothetical protein
VTEEGPRIDREGIYIDRDLADEVAIEEELDSSVVGPYRFPDPGRRRISGWIMVAFSMVSLLAIPDAWPVAAGFGLLAAWMFLSAWPLAVDPEEALRTAGAAVDFPVGHASATVRFKGWRARPRWSVVLYSAAEPPDRRALVVVDAVDGGIVEMPYVDSIDPV